MSLHTDGFSGSLTFSFTVSVARIWNFGKRNTKKSESNSSSNNINERKTHFTSLARWCVCAFLDQSERNNMPHHLFFSQIIYICTAAVKSAPSKTTTTETCAVFAHFPFGILWIFWFSLFLKMNKIKIEEKSRKNRNEIVNRCAANEL